MKEVFSKIINWIKGHKLLSILIVLVSVAITAFIILNKGKPQIVEPTPIPITEFKLNGTIPAEGKQEIVFPQSAITVFFSDDVELSTVSVQITPNIEKEIQAGVPANTIYIKPKTPWRLGVQYVIIINAKSKNGKSLEIPYSYIFEPMTPNTPSEMTEIPR